MFQLSSYPFGKVRTLEQLTIMEACQQVYIAFSDFVDAGDLDSALALHTEDVTVFQEGRPEPLVGLLQWHARLKQVRFSYPRRKTLHPVSNFRFHTVTPTVAELRAITALYDLVFNPEGKGISRHSSELVGYAVEEAQFVPVDGFWRFKIRKVGFLAGAHRLPIGTLPGHLPWDDLLPASHP